MMWESSFPERLGDLVLNILTLDYNLVRNTRISYREFGLEGIKSMMPKMYVDLLSRPLSTCSIADRRVAMQTRDDLDGVKCCKPGIYAGRLETGMKVAPSTAPTKTRPGEEGPSSVVLCMFGHMQCR